MSVGPDVSQAVVERAAAGNRSAQQELLKAYFPFVRAMSWKLVNDDADAEDLQQVVLMRIVEKLPTWRGESTIRSWIGGICVFEAKHYYRKKRVRKIVQSSSSVELTVSDTGPDAEHRAAHRQSLQHCQLALGKLSPAQRAAFLLKLNGHSVEEIASLMKATKSATRLRLYHGRKIFFRDMRRRQP